MVLIEVRNSEGVVGRCDAKCYNAEHPGCTCICGGRNHGAGLEKASENTRELAEPWIAEFVEREGLTEYQATVNERVYQMSLLQLIEEQERDRREMQVLDKVHHYKPEWSGIDAHCRLAVHRHEGRTVAIVTEPANNHGISVTNAAEWLLPELARQYGLPADTLWLEHYEPKGKQPESYDLVTLGEGGPAWQRLTLEQVETLTGA